jgi:hypothetical protein
MILMKTNPDSRTFSVSDNVLLSLSGPAKLALTWALSLQAELGLQQSSEEKASGIFIPCGMSF